MSMFLPDGGHLSHGWEYGGNKVTLVSKIWKVQFYHVDKKTKIFNYGEIEEQAVKFKPKLIISGGTAYPREMNYKRMAEIAKRVGAYYMTDVAHEAGLIIGKAVDSPFPHADVVTFTTHKTLRGPRGALIISRKELSESIDRSVFPGLQGGPHNHSIAGIAVALEEDSKAEFKKYAKQVVANARKLAEEFMKAGIEVVSGGTDKHLVLLDLRRQGLSGWVVAWALEYASIIVNRNTVPYDTGSPYYPSGLRLGTPAITTRGMKEKEMKRIAKWIIEVIDYCRQWVLPTDVEERKKFTHNFYKLLSKDQYLKNLNKEVKTFALRFPVP
jgi:glycine hydroxymethyltransferase